MGCDIHLLTEKLTSNGWECIDTFEKDPAGSLRLKSCIYKEGRDYVLFAALAGVRNYYEVKDPVAAERGIAPKLSKEAAAYFRQWKPDAHSHSWATLKELVAVDMLSKVDEMHLLFGSGLKAFVKDTIPALKKLAGNKPANYDKVRIVFFFDN